MSAFGSDIRNGLGGEENTIVEIVGDQRRQK
jgi:hypothetical protein